MKVGVVLPNVGPLATREAAFAVADRAEQWGLASLWTADHLAIPRDPSRSYPYFPGRIALDPDHAFLEPLVTLAAVAGRTERIALGVGIFIAPFRHPLVSAKMVASLDQLSGGRVLLGVGLGWIPEEYAAVGVPWRERGAILDEQIRYFRELWRSDAPRFRGERYAFEGLGFEPRPVRRDVPIWIGGNSGRAMRRAAALGDGWHLIDLAPDALEEQLPAFETACREAGRPRREVVLSMRSSLRVTEAPVPAGERVFPLTGTLGEILADLRRYAALGVEHVALAPFALGAPLADYLKEVELIAREIAPALADA